MKIAIVLIHNTLDNECQIDSLRSVLNLVEEVHEDYIDYHYSIDGLNQDIKLYQTVPFGVERPSNMDSLISYNVLYGAGDEDKTGDNPRFLNWAIKRAFDQGNDLVVYFKTNLNNLAEVIDLIDGDVVIEEEGYTIFTKAIKEIGQLNENLTGDESILDLKIRIGDING